MNIGDKILELRKSRGYSQEDIANKLNVSRQTISKWETNQSWPDLDKIVPLCELFDISTDELLMNKVRENIANENVVNDNVINDDFFKEKVYKNKRKFAINLCISIFLYFVSVIWIIFSEGINLKEEYSIACFLGIVGIATVILIYTCIVHSSNKKELAELKENSVKEENPTVKNVNNIIALIVLIIYMFLSFSTGAWHVTWILWLVYGVITEIVELIFKLEVKKDEQ